MVDVISNKTPHASIDGKVGAMSPFKKKGWM
jgi:hypothetical protein